MPTAATALAVLMSSVSLVTADAGTAAADSSALLPLKASGDIVVYGVHRRVFISDPAAGQVVVTDYAGTVTGTVGSLPGVHGLELSPDSGTLHAAVHDADAVVAIDTATATESRRISTGAGAGPAYVALAGGKLWFGYGTSGDGNMGSLDPSAADPAVTGSGSTTSPTPAPRANPTSWPRRASPCISPPGRWPNCATPPRSPSPSRSRTSYATRPTGAPRC
ncbi:YncE family protein [Streptomyces paradoxus]|uniref:YncE family protein n=1 Tax=Streptomyces paradoxus TaxID=66375 RepID=UPI0038284288